MAFLCPARRKRTKVKIRGPRPIEAPLMGRMTGSSSVDTLVRVGLEKEQGPRARMVVLRDFTPCVDDELAVKRGDKVYLLYQENDWMYVVGEDGREGFIPYTYCLPEQRCAEDLVTPDPQQPQKDSFKKASTEQEQAKHSKHGENTQSKPSYQFAPVKPGKPLTRRSSKSLPDISDLRTTSAAKSNNQRYPTDSTNSNGQTPEKWKSPQELQDEEDDKTYGMSLKRQSRSMHRRARPVSQDMTSSGRPSSARSSHSQPPSLGRSSYYNGAMAGSVSNPGTPTAVNSYWKNPYRSNYKQTGGSGDMLQKSWNPPSGQNLIKYLTKNSNLSSSYPANGTHSNNRYSGSYQHSPASSTPANEPLLYNRSNSGYSKTSQHEHGTLSGGMTLKSPQQQNTAPLVETFKKRVVGEYIALFTFTPHQENDIHVEKGEFVTVLNTDDKDWYWVKRSNSQEGFVPATYLMKVEPQKHASVSGPAATNNIANSFSNSSRQISNQQVLNNKLLYTTSQPVAANISTYKNNSLTVKTDTAKLTIANGNIHSSKSVNVHPLTTQTNQFYQRGNNHFITAKPAAPTSNSSGHPSFGGKPQASVLSGSYNASRQQQQNLNKQLMQQLNSSNATMETVKNGISNHRQLAYDDTGTTRIKCMYNFTAQVADDLTVTQGEWLYANLAHSDNDWLWVYSPTQDKAGYVPRTYTKAPSNPTSLTTNKEYFT